MIWNWARSRFHTRVFGLCNARPLSLHSFASLLCLSVPPHSQVDRLISPEDGQKPTVASNQVAEVCRHCSAQLRPHICRAFRNAICPFVAPKTAMQRMHPKDAIL